MRAWTEHVWESKSRRDALDGAARTLGVCVAAWSRKKVYGAFRTWSRRRVHLTSLTDAARRLHRIGTTTVSEGVSRSWAAARVSVSSGINRLPDLLVPAGPGRASQLHGRSGRDRAGAIFARERLFHLLEILRHLLVSDPTRRNPVWLPGRKLNH